MAESPRRRILAHVRLADICCVIGLALNFMWCSLEGHALRFAETAAQFQFLLNPRGFWLMGFCLLALLYLAVPHWLKRWENTLKGIVPLLSLIHIFLGVAHHEDDGDGERHEPNDHAERDDDALVHGHADAVQSVDGHADGCLLYTSRCV